MSEGRAGKLWGSECFFFQFFLRAGGCLPGWSGRFNGWTLAGCVVTEYDRKGLSVPTPPVGGGVGGLFGPVRVGRHDSWVFRLRPSAISFKGRRRKKMYVIVTNLKNKSLISADRGTKATLMLTILRSVFKSSTKDLSLPIFELVFQHQIPLLCCSGSAVTML